MGVLPVNSLHTNNNYRYYSEEHIKQSPKHQKGWVWLEIHEAGGSPYDSGRVPVSLQTTTTSKTTISWGA